MNRLLPIMAFAVAVNVLSACQTTPKLPPQTPVKVDSINVFSGEFQGRIEAYADVSGHLANSASQIQEPRQWREGYRLYIEINEQMPAGDVVGATVMTPFNQRVPIEITGLAPGVYIVNVNGVEEHLEIDGAGLRPAEDRGQFL